MYFNDEKKLVHTTVAARTIEIGEEITVPCMFPLREIPNEAHPNMCQMRI